MKPRNTSRGKPQSCCFGLLAVIFLISLSYFTMSKTSMLRFSVVNSQLPPMTNGNTSDMASDVHPVTEDSSIRSQGLETEEAELGRSLACELKDGQCETGHGRMVVKNSSTVVDQDPTRVMASSDELVFNEEERHDNAKPGRKPICDLSNTKSDICEADGDVRIIGKDTRMIYVANSEFSNRETGESWTIKPYARKWDKGSGAKVREVTMKLVKSHGEDKHCDVNHTIPALVFAIGGWTGNFFHDFADVLVPLFETSYHFEGEVQFLIANIKPLWINKYHKYFEKLSRYEIIDYDNDDRVHCFKQVTLGLRCDQGDFTINPSKDPFGYTMADFTKFTRSAYSLKRDHPVRPGEQAGKKPRILIVTRKATRKFTNVKEIVRMAKKVGFNAVVTEADANITRFSQVVNSCDVMMGVHGSGLTNIVFLPTHSVVIQVVPWGNLDWIAGNYFRDPSRQMKLHYLEYSINEEETTLSELYPRDHAVFKDPMSLHHQGWDTFSRIFLVEQNVKLDVRKFRPVLEHALQLLREQQYR
ncbi:beta-1,2-xylosyltransferase XYXT1-like isoform X1 [Musa acuminata AAA Group]|uniref:beta-1,2-xylosyltransferase XYXT1-like isoform X1 n=2 Tax=Musa acuminata AAA Group TaxID=214697 RepID=UPI0031D6AA58